MVEVLTALGVFVPMLVGGVIAIIRELRKNAETNLADRQKKQWANQDELVSQNEKIAEIHVLVNQRLTNVMDRVEQLTAALEKANVRVPIDPSL